MTLEQLQKKKEKPKVSVSAEVYGMFNKKSDYKPKVIKKSKETYNRIKEKLA